MAEGPETGDEQLICNRMGLPKIFRHQADK